VLLLYQERKFSEKAFAFSKDFFIDSFYMKSVRHVESKAGISKSGKKSQKILKYLVISAIICFFFCIVCTNLVVKHIFITYTKLKLIIYLCFIVSERKHGLSHDSSEVPFELLDKLMSLLCVGINPSPAGETFWR
jgi:hypothetical protein